MTVDVAFYDNIKDLQKRYKEREKAKLQMRKYRSIDKNYGRNYKKSEEAKQHEREYQRKYYKEVLKPKRQAQKGKK